MQPHIVRDDFRLSEDHPLYCQPCPVCDEPMGFLGEAIALVAVGIMTIDRKASGWTTGGAVAVHTECARPAQQSGEASR
jgi:hypothetical protein